MRNPAPRQRDEKYQPQCPLHLLPFVNRNRTIIKTKEDSIRQKRVFVIASEICQPDEVAELLDENELTYIIYDDAPANRAAESPGDSIRLIQLPPYSPFLNIVEQAISALKAAIKADIKG